jgi:hypothetical protein
MKQLLLTIIGILFFNFCMAQFFEGPYCKGGSKEDKAWVIVATTDGNFLVGADSDSSDGDLLNNNGSSDIWIYKTNASGDIIWSQIYGESNGEHVKSIIAANDGGYIVCAYRNSMGGHTLNSDFWIFKIDEDGNMLWEKFYGGDRADNAYNIISANGSGYYITGSSVDSENHNNDFVKVIRINNTGKSIWEKQFLESEMLNPTSSCLTPDGGIVITSSKVELHNTNYEIIKLSSLGKLIWQRTYGGSINDWPHAIISIPSGGYYIAGGAASSDGHVSGNHGSTDFWLIQIDEEGNLIESKCLGGSKSDIAYDILLKDDGGLLLLGGTQSGDGDVIGYTKWVDAWIICLDPMLDLEWQFCLGDESGSDYAKAIAPISDHGWMIAGYSNSFEGPFAENKGKNDAWILKLIEDTSGNINQKNEIQIDIYPNPAEHYIHLSGENILEVKIMDKMGRILHSETYKNEQITIPNGLKGSYFILVKTKQAYVIKQLILE